MSDSDDNHDSSTLLLDEYAEKSEDNSGRERSWSLLAKIYVLVTTFATVLSISVALLSTQDKLVFGGEVNHITPACKGFHLS